MKGFTSTIAATLLAASSTAATGSTNSSTSIPTLEPFIEFETTLSPQYLTSDISRYFGLFQTRGNGTFNGKINGSLPGVGNLEITYPGQYPPATNGYVTATLIFNTTSGVPLSMTAQGLVQLGVNGQPVVKVVGSAALQTRDQRFEYLNEKAFVFELCGGTAGGGGNMGRGRLFEIKSSSECSLQTI